MLLLRARVGDEEVLVNATDVVEVLPYVALREVPGQRWQELQYHGRSVPVIDLAAVYRAVAAPAMLTTRIVLLRLAESGAPPMMGVIAAQVTEMVSAKHLTEGVSPNMQRAVPVRLFRDPKGESFHLLDHVRVVRDVFA